VVRGREAECFTQPGPVAEVAERGG
jgi:hypothetical protein